MEEKNNKSITEKLSNLFDDAENRIIEAEKNNQQEKQRKKIEAEKARLKRQKDEEENKAKMKLKTESIATSIIALIYDILSNTKTRKGYIKSVDENLGKLSDESSDRSYRSYYSFDNSVLTICLNYSNAYMDRDRYGNGTCFLGRYKRYYENKTDDNGVDFLYLQEILSEYGISIERQQPEQKEQFYVCREDDLVIIKASSKQKELTQSESIQKK